MKLNGWRVIELKRLAKQERKLDAIVEGLGPYNFCYRVIAIDRRARQARLERIKERKT